MLYSHLFDYMYLCLLISIISFNYALCLLFVLFSIWLHWYSIYIFFIFIFFFFFFLVFCFFFFFQAEDGIRDSPVTGVQTCALPIYPIVFIMMWVYIYKVICIIVHLMAMSVVVHAISPVIYIYFHIWKLIFGSIHCDKDTMRVFLDRKSVV